MIWMLVHLFILKKFFSLSLPDAKHNFDGLRRLIIWFFLCPQMVWILLVFLLRIHWIAPRWSTFQRVSRNVDVILVKDFANSIDVLIWQSFLFWNQISYFNGHVYSRLIVEMKSKRCQFWKYFFEIQAVFFLVKDPTHTIQCNPLIVLYFEKQKWPVVRLKWRFHGSFYPF